MQATGLVNGAQADQTAWLEEDPGHVWGLPEISGLQLLEIRVIKSFRISGLWVVEMLDMSKVMVDYLDFGNFGTSGFHSPTGKSGKVSF